MIAERVDAVDLAVMVDERQVAVAQMDVHAVAVPLELAGSSHAHEGALLTRVVLEKVWRCVCVWRACVCVSLFIYFNKTERITEGKFVPMRSIACVAFVRAWGGASVCTHPVGCDGVRRLGWWVWGERSVRV